MNKMIDSEPIDVDKVKDIKEGEELYIHYGDDYWNERNYTEK